MYKDERKLCKSSVVKKWRCTTKIDLDYRKHMAAWYLAPPPFFSGGGGLKEPRNVCQYSNLLSNQLVLFKLAIMRCLNTRQSSERHTRLKYAFCWQRYWNVENWSAIFSINIFYRFETESPKFKFVRYVPLTLG